MNEIIEVKQAEVVEALNRAEIDIQVATAKKYPRDVNKSLNLIETYATMDKETAEECFYVLRRGDSVIEGLSVRMAEIIAGAWGNIRVQTRIVGNDGRMITAQAICHDLETNYAVAKEVKRRITDRNGKTYSDDMQAVTGNAAASIAFRNAVLAVIPKAVTKKVTSRVKQVALGQPLDLEVSRQNLVAYFGKLGVSLEQILTYLGVEKLENIDKEMVFELRGVANAINEGTTSVQEVFGSVVEEQKAKQQSEAKATEVMAKAKKAMKKAKGEAEEVKPEEVEQVEAETELNVNEIKDDGGMISVTEK